ncbi:MAG TPA: cyclase family protein [Pyrinomonadaceae bacterium]|jgi:kynurenine formamidase|nr:cyclase family protein [Pyrinomonadaceae bacterium]
MNLDYELIDVCHTIEDGMITYKGLPAPVISDHLSREESKRRYAPGTEFHIGKIAMVANTGTYLDSPFHRYADGTDLAGLDLYSLANLDAIVVRQVDKDQRDLDEKLIRHLEVKGKAVLFQTDWDLCWRTEEYSNGRHPFLTETAAQFLADSGAALVGIDSFNIDSTQDGNRPVHSILLRHNIPIVEHLCGLRDLPDSGFRFFAVPVKIRHFGSFPIRAFGLVPKTV